MQRSQPVTQVLSRAVVSYLKILLKQAPSCFENLLSPNLGITERLFTDLFNCTEAATIVALSTEIDTINSQITPELQNYFIEQFTVVESTAQAKKTASICFNDIWFSSEWQEFKKLVAVKIISEIDQQVLYERIICAFAFKVLSLAAKTNPGLEKFLALVDPLKPVLTLVQNTVGYLAKVYAECPENFEQLFSAQCVKHNGSRLFFNDFGCVDSAMIKSFIYLIPLETQKQCIESFSKINPVLGLAFLSQVQELAIQFFLPVSTSLDWSSFWNRLVQESVKDPAKQQALFLVLANAFAYKVFSVAAEHYQSLTASESKEVYLQTKFTRMQLIYIPKMLSRACEVEAVNDPTFIATLQDAFVKKVIQGPLDSQGLFDYINTGSEFVFDTFENWKNTIHGLIHDPEMLSQGDFSQIKLNEWLQKAVQLMKKLDGKKHKEELRILCGIIHGYLEKHYVFSPVSSTPQLHSAIMLCAAAKELAHHIESRTSLEKLKFTSEDLTQKQSKMVIIVHEKAVKTNSSRAIESSAPAAIPSSRSSTRITKTNSTGHIPTLRKPAESPRREERAVTPPDALSRPTSARKSAGGEVAPPDKTVRKSLSLWSLSSKITKEKDHQDSNPVLHKDGKDSKDSKDSKAPKPGSESPKWGQR